MGEKEVYRPFGLFSVGSMNSLETNTHAFVIRIWLEEAEGGEAAWRGHITHVLSGERSYLKDLEYILKFIASYLDVTGGRQATPPRDP